MPWHADIAGEEGSVGMALLGSRLVRLDHRAGRAAALLVLLVVGLAGCGGDAAEEVDTPNESAGSAEELAAPERTPGTEVFRGDEVALDVPWTDVTSGWPPGAGTVPDESGVVTVRGHDGWLSVTAHLTDDGRVRQVALFADGQGRLTDVLTEAQHVAEAVGGAGCWADLEAELSPASLGDGDVRNGSCGPAVFTLASLPDSVAFIAAADPGLR